MEILNIILPIVYILVGCALVWFVIELALTVKKARSTVEDLQPTLQNIETAVTDIQPTIKKIDPLMDRVTLTVDSVNLEMMRVDEILEDVSKITGSVSKTVQTVDTVTSAPIDLVNNVTKKVRAKLRPKYASNESVKAGLDAGSEEKKNPIVDFADAATEAVSEAYKEQRAVNAEKAKENEAQAKESKEHTEKLNQTSRKITEGVMNYVSYDTDTEAHAEADATDAADAEKAVEAAKDAATETIKEDAEA